MRNVAIGVVAVVTTLIFAGSAVAQQPFEYTVTVKGEVIKGSPGDHYLTFTGPVQIPDVTLPAGTYVFSIIAPSVIQVSNVDRTEFYGMFFTAPVLRDEPGYDYAISLIRPLSTAPARIATWFVPNKATGFEFLYQPLAGDR